MRKTIPISISASVVVAVGHSHAQNFEFLDTSPDGDLNSTFRILVADNAADTMERQDSRPDDQNSSVSGFGSFAATTATNNLVRVEAAWDGTPTSLGDQGLAGGFTQQFFTVDRPGTLRFSWDLEGTDFANNGILTPPGFPQNGSLAALFVYDDSTPPRDADFVELIDTDNPTGVIEADVVPGNIYGMQLEVGFALHFEPGKTSFVQAELIPAPGVGALFGIAGIAVARRRRR